MERDVQYRKNNMTGTTKCSGVWNGYYLVGDIKNTKHLKVREIPLHVWSDIKDVVNQMFMHNGNVEKVYIWAFKQFEDIDAQKCYAITKEEHKLFRVMFLSPIKELL